jgi:hypothetical protein
VGTGDSTTIVVPHDDGVGATVMQIDLHDMAKADDDAHPEVPVVDRLVEALPIVEGRQPQDGRNGAVSTCGARHSSAQRQ